MLVKEDWHTHNILCGHAQGNLEDYVLEAIKKNIDSLGFSDHFPYEMLNSLEGIPYEEYSMTLQEMESYVFQAKKLREEYEDQLNIRIGFELDFIENQERLQNHYLEPLSTEIDYLLGSIHLLSSKENKKWCVDDNRFIGEYKKQGIVNVYLEYYKTMRKMISSKDFDFDIVSHFDLPKKYRFFPQKKESVKEEVLKTLDLIKEHNLAIEINTGGFRKDVGEQYPSISIIKEIKKLDIPVLLGSDAHKPEEIAFEFEKMIKLLKDMEFNKLAHFKKRKISYIDI
ncbi:MAG: Histidinol-phosphatase [Promethearchaeota archaeon]|nr:MAG: Histidinol-phosphatase [Candidatus Lokiarchaeota archaeon]